MVATKYIAVRTYNGQAPSGTIYWHVAHHAGLVVHFHRHAASLASGHLVAQSYYVSLLLCVSHAENGLIK